MVVVFRAMGFVTDKAVLDHVVYDTSRDDEMVELFRPSLEEAFVIQTQAVALDFIGRRGREPNLVREQRIAHAEELLQKDLLPHVGTKVNRKQAEALVHLASLTHTLSRTHSLTKPARRARLTTSAMSCIASWS